MQDVSEEILEAIQGWNEKAERSDPVVLVLAGKTGVGKSTLLNNFLGLSKEKKAESKRSGKSVTTKVNEYKKVINGIAVKIIDTPGLEAADLTEMESKETIAMLSAFTDGKADLLLYCAIYLRRCKNRWRRCKDHPTLDPSIWPENLGTYPLYSDSR